MSFDIRRGASCLRASKGLFWKEKGVMSRPRGCFPWCGLTSVSRSVCLGHGTSRRRGIVLSLDFSPLFLSSSHGHVWSTC